MKHHIFTAAAASVLLGACANQLPYQPYQPYQVYPGGMVPQPAVVSTTPQVIVQPPVVTAPPVQVRAPAQTATTIATTTPPVTKVVTTTPPSTISTAVDVYGCQTATGATWSVLLQQCVQLFNVANIRMVDPDNQSLAAYAIFSKDKKQAEIFSATLPKGIILAATKGGFISSDGKIRLVDLGRNNWKLVKK
ncbi:hypothetical protein [Conchiformibius steedae]|uniref:hypothetical protein n=1 Tax=Conchiformibius steedae TaxID=153493 RepID=UPI0026F1E7BD|nr:hypothetical protein [Conchiformibius steedae]